MRWGSIVVLLLAACFLSACRDAPDVSPQPAHAPVLIPMALEKAAPRLEAQPEFVEVAQQVGIDFTFFNDEVKGRYFLPEVMGSGAAWFDYDLDGKLDLYLVNGARLEALDQTQDEHPSRLFRGDGARFDDVGSPAGVSRCGGFGQGCAVGDFDADGFPDLYVCNYGPNRLFKNCGDGTFLDATPTAGVGDPLWGSSCVWVDLNDDGLLDLVVVNYLDARLDNTKACQFEGRPEYCGPGSHEAQPDRAYLNGGDGTFSEASQRLGLDAPNGKGLAVVVADFDGDARPEIYVANDMAENFLYRRVGSGSELRYENVAGRAGCSVEGDGSLVASMGLSCADFDGNGLIDIFVTNYYTQGNVLYKNAGNLLFFDDSRRARVAAASFQNLGFGTVPFDYDLDGDRDLFVANGHVLGPLQQPHEMHPQLLHNDGAGQFEDVSQLAGGYFADKWLGRGAAGADYDSDGLVDLVVTHLHRPVVLLHNQTRSANHFIGFDLRSPARLPPLGARIVVTAGDRRQVVPVVGGGSYLCHSDPRIVIGLGKWNGVVDVEIFWPSGSVARFRELRTDRYWRIMEGGQPQDPSALVSLDGMNPES